MSVFVAVEDKEGEPLIDVFEVERIYRKFPRDSGLCLRFVGEAEDASFNPTQASILQSELEALSGTDLDQRERKELERLLAVCKSHAGKRNEYLRFYGEARGE